MSEDDPDTDVMEVCEVESTKDDSEKDVNIRPKRQQRPRNQEPATPSKRPAVSTCWCTHCLPISCLRPGV